MAAFEPGTHKLVASATSNLKDAVPLDSRDLISRMFIDMGLTQVAISNVAPSDKSVLWWHRDVRQAKRWDAVQGNWFALTPNQFAMHLIQRAIKGTVTDTNVEQSDLFMFWDVSLGELKVITRNSLMDAIGALRTLGTQEGVKGGGTLGENRTLSLDLNGLAAKALPTGDDVVGLYSIADGAHRKSTVDQVAAGISASDYMHSEMLFWGMM